MIEREEFLFGIEEKFLAATELVDCGNYPQAKIVLHEILEAEPGYARAHFDLARVYYSGLYDLKKAVYHIRLCLDIEPEFAPAYYIYLDLLFKRHAYKEADAILKSAWETPGICRSCIANRRGKFEEAQKNYAVAEKWYKEAFMQSLGDCCGEDFEKNLARIKRKRQMNLPYAYNR